MSIDQFGDDTAPGPSESTTTAPPVPGAVTGTSSTPALTPAAAVAGAPAAPTLQQAVDKAVAKASADAIVATVPTAVHSVKLAPLAPTVLGSTAAGAAIGTAIFPGPGTLVGAGAGWLVERYQIGGGPFGKVARKAHATWLKHKTGLTGIAVPVAPPAPPITPGS